MGLTSIQYSVAVDQGSFGDSIMNTLDCLNYILLFSDALNAWGTINQIGLCAQAYNTTDPAAISCIHWKES